MSFFALSLFLRDLLLRDALLSNPRLDRAFLLVPLRRFLRFVFASNEERQAPIAREKRTGLVYCIVGNRMGVFRSLLNECVKGCNETGYVSHCIARSVGEKSGRAG